ncbi:MAG: condensation domain-containing protein, partial [Catenulispora sp.]
VVRLEFAGPTDGADSAPAAALPELTWGQRFVWDILRDLAPENHYLNLRLRVHLPREATRERVLSAVHTLIREYESLRTRFPTGADGEPRQLCDAAGELIVELCDTGPGHVRRLAEEDEERLWHVPFRNESEWPLRVSVISTGGRPRQVVFVFSHLAVDAWGCAVLRARFLELVRAAGAGSTAGTAQAGQAADAASPPAAGWQPRARAAFEQSAPGRQANEAALAHWRRFLESAPQTTFPALTEAGGKPLFPGVGLHSEALAAATRALAVRHRVGPAAVLLAAFATIIGIRTESDAVPLMLAAGNRFTSADAASVGTFYQAAPALIRLDPASLTRTIAATHRASTLAYLRGQSDPRDVARLVDSTNARRGLRINLSSTVNVAPEPALAEPALQTAPDVAALRAMAATTRISELEGRDRESLLVYLHVKSLRSRAVIELFCDSRLLSRDVARRILTNLEYLLMEALETGDLTRDQVAELVGIGPLPMPHDGVVVDHCRIDLDAVRTILADLPEALDTSVFVVDGRLVAYMVAKQPTTPEQVHAAVLSRLDGALTMAPHRYVICRDAPAPAESGALAAWERQAVLLEGDGRPDGEILAGSDSSSIDIPTGV